MTSSRKIEVISEGEQTEDGFFKLTLSISGLYNDEMGMVSDALAPAISSILKDVVTTLRGSYGVGTFKRLDDQKLS